MPDELLTQEDIARERKCSVRTLERERVAGTGCPFVKIGARVYYRRSDWNEFLASRRRTSTSDIGVAA